MLRNDESGQLMLIAAFVLAILVVTISLMLNNVIYSSNMAYTGFMDQSFDSDLALKQTTTDEAVYAYTQDYSAYNAHMDDYEKAINNITSIKGRYIELSVQPPANPTPMPVTYSKLLLSVYGKDSRTAYTIYTGKNNIAAPPMPSPSPLPGCHITLVSSKSNVTCGGADMVKLTATVTDGGGNPVSNVWINFNKDTDTGDNIFDGIDPSHTPPYLITSPTGDVIAYYYNSANNTGQVHINATVGSYVSNTVTIAYAPPPPPVVHSPAPAIAGQGISHAAGSSYIIALDLNFGSVSNVTVDQISVVSDANGVSPQYINYNPATHRLTMTVYPSGNAQFTIGIGLRVNGNVGASPYMNSGTLTITGTKNGISAVTPAWTY